VVARACPGCKGFLAQAQEPLQEETKKVVVER
jgi:uncharacterized protein YbaR (Trm112 family)